MPGKHSHIMLLLVVPVQGEEAGSLALVREEGKRLTEFYSVNKLKKEAGEYLKSCSPAMSSAWLKETITLKDADVGF